jgi:hypothetical protein
MPKLHKNFSTSAEGQNDLSSSIEEESATETPREAVAPVLKISATPLTPKPHKNPSTSAEGYSNPSTSAEEQR